MDRAPNGSTNYQAPGGLVTREPVILLLTLIMVSFSLIMIYSTTGVGTLGSGGDPHYYLKRQAVAVGIGLVAMMGVSFLSVDFLKRISPFCYLAALGALGVTLIPGISNTAGGATRWVYFGPVRFQPGELVKVLMVVFWAGFYDRHQDSLHTFKQGVVVPVVLTIPLALLFLLQPDFGSVVVLVSITMLMGLVSGVRLGYFVGSAVMAALVALPLVLTSPYRMKRLLAFLSPLSDPSGKGYLLVQSLIALGSGKVTGLGMGRSQQKLHYLPAAHTDFIFAVIGEELGFVGCVMLIGMFLVLMWRSLRIGMRFSNDVFCAALAIGLGMLIVLPALLNMGVVTGLLPTKGMVLPLIGYGGSSMVVSLTTIGMLLGLFRVSQLRGITRK